MNTSMTAIHATQIRNAHLERAEMHRRSGVQRERRPRLQILLLSRIGRRRQTGRQALESPC
jgi:hypothetical protein